MTSLNFAGAERAHNAPGLARRELNFTRAEVADETYLSIFPQMMRNEELVGEAIYERQGALPALLLAIEAIATADDTDASDSAHKRAFAALRRLREEVAAYIDPIAQRRADAVADDYWPDNEREPF